MVTEFTVIVSIYAFGFTTTAVILYYAGLLILEARRQGRHPDYTQ